MKLNAKRSANHAGQTDQRMDKVDIVRLPPINEQTRSLRRRKKNNEQSQALSTTNVERIRLSRKKPFRVTELQLESRLVENLRNQIYMRLERRFHTSPDDVTGSTERLGANDDAYQYRQTLKSKEDSFFLAYNEVGLRFMNPGGSGSKAQRISPLNSKGSANSSRFVPPFYLALPGLPEAASDKTGLDVVLGSSRSGVDTRAWTHLTGGSIHSRPRGLKIQDGDEDLDAAVSPVTSATGRDVEEKEVLGRQEVGLQMKVLEGDFSSSDRHRSAAIGFYVHSTSETEYERTVLMERVYPHLREYANSRGINLEIVDPWWGMDDESGIEEHTQQRLLKTTITRCHDDAKRLGKHPYFVTFLTESNAPSEVLPSEISHREFHTIMQAMSEELERLRNSLIQEENTSRSIHQAPGKLLEEEEEQVEEEEAEEEEQVEGIDTDLVDGVGEEKKDLMSVEVFQERIQTILSWYQLDENRTPSVYRLQTPSVLFPDVLSRNGRIRWQARKSWSFIGRTLLQTLQDFASKTLVDDKMALQKYFTSSCEIELDQFLDLHHRLNNNDNDEDSFDSCLWFRPEVQDPSDLDLINNESVQGDMESTRGVSDIADKTTGGSLSEDPLARKLDNAMSRKVVHTYAPPIGVDGNAARATRTQLPPYVERLTDAFDDAVRDVIDRAADAFPVDEVSRLEREIAAHLSGCVNRSQSFFGRQRELLAIKKYIRGSSNRPLVVSGKTGSGVTSLIAKAAMEARNWVKRRSITVARLVGETMESQTVLSLLRSLCLQLNHIQSSEHTEPVPREWNALFNYFQDRLESISQHQTIFLFIDSLHELQASNDRDRVLWIPQTLPSNVRLVISTADDTNSSLLRLLRNWIPSDEKSNDSNFLELEEFPRSDITKVTHDWSSKRNDRSVTETQQRVIEESFDACPSPLYAQLVLEEASRWTSSMDDVKLGLTVRSLVLTLLGRLEREYGDVMVRRALGYLALSRHGLTTNEIDDLLCLDELVFDEVHALQRPPLRRLPPLMLLRFLDEGRVLLKEFYSDGYQMRKYAHVLFREIVKERYVNDGRTLRTYHRVMADYFSDQGTCDGKRDGKGDGKGEGKATAKPVITAQPLYWEDAEVDGASNARRPSRRVYNVRRLDELPHHLTFSQQTDKLKEFCFCNLDYLLARCECSALGLRQLIGDLEIAVNAEQDDLEVRLVLKVVRMSALVLQEDPRQFASQFAGRLLQILASDKPVSERDPDRYPYLKTMLRRARDSQTYSNSLVALIPSVACLVPPSGASYQLLSAHRGPITAMATSADGLRAVTASEDNTMRLWDLVTGWTLQKIRGVGRDVYEVRLASSDKLAVTSEVGLIRIWDLRTSECLQTMRKFKDPAALVVASGGTLLAAVFQGSNYLRVWNLEGRFELLRETVIEVGTGKPVHKDCTTILSKTCAGSTILYALRDSNAATVYDLKEGKVIRKMRIHESGSITAVVIARTYGICAARYPETRLLDRVCLEVFDLETGKQLRSIKSCGWDVIQELSVNAIGSHAVAFCSNRTIGTSCVSTWNIETESHKHVAKHGGASVLGAVGDLRFVLTAAGDRPNEVRVWNLKDSIEAKSPKERPRSGVSRILTMRDHPQYVLAQSTDGRRVDVWNVAMHDFCGSVVHSQAELTTGSDDTLLLHNAMVVILCNREYVKMEVEAADDDEEVLLVYRTMKAYDLRLGRWKSHADGLTIPVLPIDDYVLLSEDQLLSPSDNRSQFLVWDVPTGNLLFQIKIPFREKEPTGDMEEEDSLTVGGVGRRRFASSAAMTPWTRRSETRTARGRRHNAEEETARRRRHELQSERHNCVDGFLISADRSTMVSSFNAHHICVFDLKASHRRQVGVLRSVSSMMQLTVADITRDGRSLVTVTYDDDEKEGLVSLWDLPSGTVSHRLSHDGWINAIAVSDDARRIVFCSQTKSSADRNRLCVWRPEVPSPLDLLELPGHPRFNEGVHAQLRLTRDATRAVVCAGDISVWDLEHSELLCVFSPDSRIQSFDVALNGQLVVIGFQDVPSIVTLKLVSGCRSSQDTSVKVPAVGVGCLFGEDPTEVMENGAGEVDEDPSDEKIRINPALFFQSTDDA